MDKEPRYYREIAARVIERYEKLADGTITMYGVTYFDPNLLNHRIDIERFLATLPPAHREILLAVHCEGLGHAEACTRAGIVTSRPDHVVAKLELAAGQALCLIGLDDLLDYLMGGPDDMHRRT